MLHEVRFGSLWHARLQTTWSTVARFQTSLAQVQFALGAFKCPSDTVGYGYRIHTARFKRVLELTLSYCALHCAVCRPSVYSAFISNADFTHRQYMYMRQAVSSMQCASTPVVTLYMYIELVHCCLRLTCYRKFSLLSFALHKIGTLRQFLSQAATEKLVHALIMPRIDFCNSLLYGLSDTQISRLQRIQNSAARLVKRTPVRQPISPILQELHWLPVKQRIKYKILLLILQCLSGTAPSYLQELIRLYTPARNLQSSSKSILISPSVKTYFYGGRSFQSAAADLWNNLPESVKSVNTTEIFKRVLKTHLFTP